MMRTVSTRYRGFSLVELMVSMVIGLILMLAVSIMVARQESIRRGVTSGNDLTSNAGYVAYTLDRELRSAGAGFSQATAQSYGCLMHASRDNSQLLPAPEPFPAPFASLPQSYRLAPLIVFAGAGTHGSDMIAIAAGNSALSEAALPVVPKSAGAGELKLSNTLGMRGGDLLLLSGAGVGCMLQQLSKEFSGGVTQRVTLDGRYAANTIGDVDVTQFSGSNAFAFMLGNVVGNQPKIQLLGIDTNDTLVSYDLLQLGSEDTQSLAEGVVDMKVLYGVDMARGSQKQVTAWIAPTAAGFTAAELADGSDAARQNLQHIFAVRVGLVLRSDLVEKTEVTPAQLTLFSDLPADVHRAYTVPLDTAKQRYRTVEFTVPLRNVRYSR
ncbi:PilW family protein [Roseateles sp.]|uniref:PilW family protein n=1 Tax=Roseateles sp. TaxID=1971397 RepID=UPI003267506B